MTLQNGTATRLTVYVGETDRWRHKPLYFEIVHRAHQAALAGCSVFRGLEGFGKSNHIHTTRILSLSEDLPMMIVIVDAEEKIRAFLPQLDELDITGLVTIDAVEVVTYAGRPQTVEQPRRQGAARDDR
jgi:PII-like signaling protein